jgi:hypothetical protein
VVTDGDVMYQLYPTPFDGDNLYWGVFTGTSPIQSYYCKISSSGVISESFYCGEVILD